MPVTKTRDPKKRKDVEINFWAFPKVARKGGDGLGLIRPERRVRLGASVRS